MSFLFQAISTGEGTVFSELRTLLPTALYISLHFKIESAWTKYRNHIKGENAWKKTSLKYLNTHIEHVYYSVHPNGVYFILPFHNAYHNVVLHPLFERVIDDCTIFIAKELLVLEQSEGHWSKIIKITDSNGYKNEFIVDYESCVYISNKINLETTSQSQM
jgi:hypothetical protein